MVFSQELGLLKELYKEIHNLLTPAEWMNCDVEIGISSSSIISLVCSSLVKGFKAEDECT